MSFYSFKNAYAECSPGVVNGNILTGLNHRQRLKNPASRNGFRKH